MATDFAPPHPPTRPPATTTVGAPAQLVTLTDPGWSQALPHLAENSPAIIGIFRLPGFELVYLNKTGLRRIDPRGDSTSHELTLPEFFGLPSQAKLTNEIIPQARVMGRWSGRCDMRDVWGSEFQVQAVLTCVTGADPYGACLCL